MVVCVKSHIGLVNCEDIEWVCVKSCIGYLLD
jgi:hypothetical protein